MIIQLEDYKNGEARAWEIKETTPPDIIGIAGVYWKYDCEFESDGQTYHSYERATFVEMDPL